MNQVNGTGGGQSSSGSTASGGGKPGAGSGGQKPPQVPVCETWQGSGGLGEYHYGWLGVCYKKGGSRSWPGPQEGLAHDQQPGSCPVCKGPVKYNSSRNEPKR